MKKYLKIYILFAILLAVGKINAQEVQSIFFDAVTFQSDTAGLARLDCYAVVPYQIMKFNSAGEKYYSKYTAYFTVTDKDERPIAEKIFERYVTAENYFRAQGGAADFDYLACSFDLNPEKYKIRLTVKSETDNKNYERIRNVSLIDFNEHVFAMSGVLLVSKMEENNGQYDITPYLSDNIAPVANSFIAVFETYNKGENRKLKFVPKLFDEDSKEVFEGDFFVRDIQAGKSANYIPMQLPKTLKQGNYVMRIYALPIDADSLDYDDKIIAGAERSISLFRSFGSGVYEDIEKAIEQTRYAASEDELDIMRDADSEDEKIRLFDEFWAKMDPTPGTDRNEAFEVYFSRVKFAEQRFASNRSKGWKSDMGHVFVVYGNPYSTERSTPDYRGRVTEKWTYANGDIFIFVDFSGFDDFRLYSPSVVNDQFTFDF